MNNDKIFISINPDALKKIEEGLKTYEFRNYKPKYAIKYMYVYETAPTSEMKYIIKIGDIIEYPNKIPEIGDGNIQFNNGAKSRYAYSIKSVYKLEKSISLKELRETFGFTPPQGFVYEKTYPELSQFMRNVDKCKVRGEDLDDL